MMHGVIGTPGKSAIAAVVEGFASRIAAGLQASYRDDRSLRTSVDSFVARLARWQGAVADLDRIARLGAILLAAEAAGNGDGLAARGPSNQPGVDVARALREIIRAAVSQQEEEAYTHDIATLSIHNLEIDQLGPLFESLPNSSERRQVGQFYSSADPIDLILGFCLRFASETVLDPSCGCGAFLVRALSRLASLTADTAADGAAIVCGVDSDPLALLIAAANVAARCDRADLRHADFFALSASDLPPVRTIVGNPPYTRHEVRYGNATAKATPWDAVEKDWQLRVGGRAGLHVPFLLHAGSFLPPGGRMGMLTSNSWLNADYGAALRRFLLEHCRIIAIISPGTYNWFGAAVNAIAVIAEREDDVAARTSHLARFVVLRQPLATLLRTEVDAKDRWTAVDRLISRIESAKGDDGAVRTLAVPQPALSTTDKWALYLRAPEVYFDLLRELGDRLCPLGELATVRRGLTTGANTFFYVVDATETMSGETLAMMGVGSGEDRVVVSGDGSRHILEGRFLKPIVISPRMLHGLSVQSDEITRRVVLLPKDRAALDETRALAYVEWGERQGLAKRSTCDNRRSWWSLEPAAPGDLLWCKTHFARHLAPLNPTGVLADCNLYHVTAHPGVDIVLLAATLNSAIGALWKELYGRANLGEGALKTEVIDLVALPVPDLRRFEADGATALRRAWAELVARPVEPLPLALTRPERRALDEALLRAVGCARSTEAGLRERLYDGLIELLHERLRGPSRPGRAEFDTK